MTKNYIVTIMDIDSYYSFCRGGYNYHLDYVIIPAETADEAFEKAKKEFPELKTEKEWITLEAESDSYTKDLAKSLNEFKKEKITMYQKEIADLTKEIEKLQEYLDKYEMKD